MTSDYLKALANRLLTVVIWLTCPVWFPLALVAMGIIYLSLLVAHFFWWLLTGSDKIRKNFSLYTRY